MEIGSQGTGRYLRSTGKCEPRTTQKREMKRAIWCLREAKASDESKELLVHNPAECCKLSSFEYDDFLSS